MGEIHKVAALAGYSSNILQKCKGRDVLCRPSCLLLFFELGEDGFEACGGDGKLFREFGLAGGWGER